MPRDFLRFYFILVICFKLLLTGAAISANSLKSNHTGILHKREWLSHPKVHPAYNLLVDHVEKSPKWEFCPTEDTVVANGALKPDHLWLDEKVNNRHMTLMEHQHEQSQLQPSKEIKFKLPIAAPVGFLQPTKDLVGKSVSPVVYHRYDKPSYYRPTNTVPSYRYTNSKMLFRPTYVTVLKHPSPILNEFSHHLPTQVDHSSIRTRGQQTMFFLTNNWPTNVQPMGAPKRASMDDWSDITEPLVNYPIHRKLLYDQAFHTALRYLMYILDYDTGDNRYSKDWFWTNSEWQEPSNGYDSYPANFSYPSNRLIFKGFTLSNFQDFQGRSDNIKDFPFPKKFVLPSLKLCSERIKKGFKFENVNYYLSTEDPEHTYLDRAVRYREPKLFTWPEALNVCRRRCMTPIAFENQLKFEVFGRLMVKEKIQRIWTGGRLCNSRHCRNFKLLNPLSIFGWTWVGSAGPIPRVDRKPKGFTSRLWSSSGPLGCFQPDNAEFYVRNVTESCVALLNNEYGDGVRLHDLACYHKLPVLCQDEEQLIKYAENIYNVRLPRYP